MTAATLACLTAAPVWAGEAGPPLLRIAAIEKHAGSVISACVLTEVYRQAGLQLELVPVPVPRASLLAASGQTDGELVRVYRYNEDKPDLLRVEPAFRSTSVRAYSHPDRPVKVEVPGDLLRYQVGAIRGMVYAESLTQGHPAVRLAQTSEQVFRMLQVGRIDLVLETAVGAETTMRKLGLQDLVASPELARFEMFHFLHRRHAAQLPRLGAVVSRMGGSGELERLQAHCEASVTPADVQQFTLPGAPRNPP